MLSDKEKLKEQARREYLRKRREQARRVGV